MSEEAAEPLPPFDPAAPYEDGWQVAAFEPGRRLVVEVARPELVRRARTVAVALLVPVLLFGALLLATFAERGASAFATYPLAAIGTGVVVVALFSLGRALRRLSSGVRLELDAAARTVTGFPAARRSLGGALADFGARLVTAPLSQVQDVELAIFRHPDDPRRPAFVALAVRLTDGTTLEAPAATTADPGWEDARDYLLPLALELARLAGVEVQLHHRWNEERRVLSPLDAPPR